MRTAGITEQMEREKLNSGTPWEPLFGFSRAVKVGNTIYLSGTTATNDNGDIIGVNDMYQQTKQSIENIKKALKHYGSTLSDIVRVRAQVTEISHWKMVAKAHREAFERIRPAFTLLEVSGLIDPRMLISIDCVAVLDSSD